MFFSQIPKELRNGLQLIFRELLIISTNVKEIKNKMATQADIDALTASENALKATIDTQNTSLADIATKVAALVAAQNSGQSLDLTALQASVAAATASATSSGTAETGIESELNPPASSPTPTA